MVRVPIGGGLQPKNINQAIHDIHVLDRGANSGPRPLIFDFGIAAKGCVRRDAHTLKRLTDIHHGGARRLEGHGRERVALPITQIEGGRHGDRAGFQATL